jgi:hypothetical protein
VLFSGNEGKVGPFPYGCELVRMALTPSKQLWSSPSWVLAPPRVVIHQEGAGDAVGSTEYQKGRAGRRGPSGSDLVLTLCESVTGKKFEPVGSPGIF